jgi:serine phosphatase RsbU (regulator of sigma subunit)
VKKTKYENLQFSVKKDDLLFLYSDGLVETRDENMNIKGIDFFEKIIQQSIQKHYDTLEELSGLIFEEIRETDHSNRFEDDATLIIIQM